MVLAGQTACGSGADQEKQAERSAEPTQKFQSLSISPPEGTTYSLDCKVGNEIPNIGFSECFIFPITEQQRDGEYDERHKAIGIELGKQIGFLGYSLDKRKTHEIWFEKSLDNNCNRRLISLFWYDADYKQAKDAILNGYISNLENNSIILIQEKDPICGEARLHIPEK